ncbi:MAG: hypothetical protein HKN47_08215 [Pirellulaceae bacterium]|nr:hypothetical protein [Pirellulaceae bacterium]
MQHIYVNCESGHRIKAGSSLRGKTLPCPKCRKPVVIAEATDPLSDTGVMRILGDASPLPRAPLPMRMQLRPCPQCECDVRKDAPICQHCRSYIGASTDYTKRQQDQRSTF